MRTLPNIHEVPADDYVAKRSELSEGKRSAERTVSLVHVMIVNFSHKEIELPKATVLGVAEETSASIVAKINEEVKTNPKHRR
jgi:hypothetical protein